VQLREKERKEMETRERVGSIKYGRFSIVSLGRERPPCKDLTRSRYNAIGNQITVTFDQCDHVTPPITRISGRHVRLVPYAGAR
jgi:hypothetical protein